MSQVAEIFCEAPRKARKKEVCMVVTCSLRSGVRPLHVAHPMTALQPFLQSHRRGGAPE